MNRLLRIKTATDGLFSKMSTFTVRQGINVEKQTPGTQVLVLGRKSVLKNVDFDAELAKKLTFVDNALFNEAKNRLAEAGKGSIPLYLNIAMLAVVSDEVSRHNTPSNAHAIYKEIKALKLAKGVKDLSIVLYTDYANAMASVAALARAFPLFSAKSKKESSLENVEVELVIQPQKILSENEIAFLQNLCDNIRTCARLVDTPTNTLHSEKLLDEALVMVGELGVPIEKTIIKGNELLEKGFIGIYSVGQAAKHPPIFACFSYTPKDATETYALVGKGIVYDTGGLSLKGKMAMPSMKIDMAGAAGVLSAFCTLVKAGFNQKLHCLLCIAGKYSYILNLHFVFFENHISPEATRPDDILKMLSGKTVEVNNTDAEGRLVLADGVFYANDTLKAGTIIDMATLTGLQTAATGKYHAAILSNSEELEIECVQAGKKSGDLVHPLPYAPELHFAENLASKVADMKNACMDGSPSGPPTAIAGLFIGSHIGFGAGGRNSGSDGKEMELAKANWLHIDMAALTTLGKWDGHATGYGVALLCSLLAKHTKIGVAKCL